MSTSSYTLGQIHEQLQQQFIGADIAVSDESAAHAGHTGNPNDTAISHIHVHVRSKDFTNLGKVAQHRAVHAALQAFYAQGLHAVVLDTAAA
jgi:BolA protein